MKDVILTGDILNLDNILIPSQECSNIPSINGAAPKLESIFIKGSCCNVVDGTSKEDEYLKKSKLLSEFVTEAEKAIVRNNLGIADKFNLLWGNIKGHIENLKDLILIINTLISNKIDKELEGNSASLQIRYSNSEYPNIHNIKDAIDSILYKDLSITFSCNPSVAEYGSVVDRIIYNWEYNKSNIISQFIDDILLDISLRKYIIEGPFTSTINKVLKVNDGTKDFSKSTALNFYLGLYYGTSSKQLLETSDIIQFNKKLLPNKNTTITVNAGLQEYIYICVPYIYGEAVFKVGGFEGGFALIDDNFTFNKYIPIRYRIYRSDNKGLGNTTITIL